MQTGDHSVWQESGSERLCVTTALAFLLFFHGSWEGTFVLVSHSTVSHESLGCWRLDKALAFKNDVFLLVAPPSWRTVLVHAAVVFTFFSLKPSPLPSFFPT